MKLLALDVGGTEIKYAVAEDTLTLTDSGCAPTPTDGFDSFVGLIRDIYLPHRDEVEGVAMCLPGPVDVENGRCGICGAMKYPHTDEVGRALSEACGCPVVLENDGKAAALAEHGYGAVRDCRNAAVFLIGTGVGGGLIIDSKVVRGPSHMAGEFSFVNTDSGRYDDPSQTVGSRCSTTFLLNRYRELSGSAETVDGREFFRRLSDDENARTALDELCGNVAVQLFNLYWLLDLEKVAIGGGISRQQILLEWVRRRFAEVREKSMTARFRREPSLTIVPCRFSNDANLIGSCITYGSQKGRTRG